MDLKKLAFSLTLSASLFAGCGDDEPATTTSTTTTTATTTSTTNVLPDVGVCGDAGAAVLYRLNELHIPTPADVDAGRAVGHNVDGTGSVCGVDDYAGGVDNSLIDLAAALPALSPDDPIDLQVEVDKGLNCAVGATDCKRIDLIVSVRSGAGCVIVEVLDGTGGDAATLAGPFVGSLDASGNMSGRVPSLSLVIPYTASSGQTADIALQVSSVILTGTASPTALSNVIIGGALEKTAFEQMIMDLLPLLGDSITFDSIGPILANLYDVKVGADCAALSVGLTASAVVVNP